MWMMSHYNRTIVYFKLRKHSRNPMQLMRVASRQLLKGLPLSELFLTIQELSGNSQHPTPHIEMSAHTAAPTGVPHQVVADSPSVNVITQMVSAVDAGSSGAISESDFTFSGAGSPTVPLGPRDGFAVSAIQAPAVPFSVSAAVSSAHSPTNTLVSNEGFGISGASPPTNSLSGFPPNSSFSISPATTSTHGSTNKHKGISVGLVAGVVVAVTLFILPTIIYFIRKWVLMNTQRQIGEKSLTITPLSLPHPSDVDPSPLPTSKQSHQRRRSETIRQPESVHAPPDSSQMDKGQDEGEERVIMDAAQMEANSSAAAEIDRRGIMFTDAHTNLIPRPAVNAEMQIADLQQQVQMIQGVLHLLTVGRDDAGHSLASSVSEPPPEYASQSGSA
ncbi:hypothetical protein BDQ12DRAFT_670823 [Crucibulum laeve]|uniref:Uncharacterized protein n=1 Tax=Crucibulum laeve TaxID=68775 RepID=A0A5C3LI41_9AGAR|nr:hypothetical protein BDQ12DRAFT_670823 [Crucibulum laeve]